MSGWYLHNLLLGAIVGVTGLAWLKGSWPERLGASLNLLFAVLFYVLQLLMKPSALSTSLLVMDGLLGVGFMLLALRYTSLWLGAAMLLQGGQFSLHAYYYVMAKPVDRLFAVVNNVVSWGILLAIVTGVGATWMNSRKAARKQLAL